MHQLLFKTHHLLLNLSIQCAFKICVQSKYFAMQECWAQFHKDVKQKILLDKFLCMLSKNVGIFLSKNCTLSFLRYGGRDTHVIRSD